MPKTAALRAAVFKLFTKNLMGGCSNTPPPAGRGLKELSIAILHSTVALLVPELCASLSKIGQLIMLK